ncbi:MAG: NACHT domain-containing protein, partial [Halothece sp.]
MDISLIFGSGSLSQGFNSVVVNIDKKKQCEASLPRNEKLVELQRRWRLLYEALLQRFNPERRSVFEVDEGDITNASEGSFEEICQEIETVFNQWLDSDSFRRIVNTLHQQLGTGEPIRVIIESGDRTLQKLPWHLWDYVKENPQVGIGFSSLNYDLQTSQEAQSEQIRVLAIFGDATGIDLEKDRATLENFTNAEIHYLEEPSRQEFNDQLWEQNWDILFFAGHSNSNQSGGEIGLNATESLSLADLKNGLREAITNGLKLAIFNSCDGLELAYLLGELNLPQLIVMQADVPNQVAQHFLDYFLNALIMKAKSVELAHREAKERLEGLENRYLGATWLPKLFQNPSIQWHPSSHSPMKIDWSAIALEMLTRQVTSNPLTDRDGKRFDLDDIFVPLGLVERRKVEKKTDSTSAEKGSEFYQQEEVTRRYEREEFLDDVLTKGNTPKSQGKRLAIIGEPGAGKTTQLQKMGDWLTSQGNNVVIWVSLADLQGQTLEDYLLTEWLKKALKTPRVNQEQEEKFINLFQQQSVWLLLDGVDEMGDGNPLRQLAGQLRQGWLSSARVILTCRLNVWDAGKNALDEFDVYRNLDFSDELRQEFTQKWFQESPELAQALEKELTRPGKERIRNLVRNPLRLTLLCAFWERRQGELPETKAQLYHLFVDIFYEWKEESFPITTGQKRELNQALGRLAKKAIDQVSGRFRLSKELVCSVLGDEETSLFRLAIDIGWLNQVGVAQENPDEPVFAFFHPTFEEYFAAIDIDDWHFFLTHYPS